MAEKILNKFVENNIEYYLVKLKGSILPRRFSKEELMKRNKKLYEQFENINNKNNSLIKKKRKKCDSNDDNISKDLSSEETQRIHRKKKIKKENEHKPKNLMNNIKKDNILENKNHTSHRKENKKLKENYIQQNNIENNLEDKKQFKEGNKQFREGALLTDIPKRIVNVGYKNRIDKKLYCMVEWEQNPEIEILDSIVDYYKIKEQYSNLLLEFYESKLVFLYDE